MRRKAAATSQPDPMTVALTGGLDLVTIATAIPPGRAIACVNYEPVAQGYARVGGIERVDGHTAPSAASYSIIDFSNGTAAIVTGETVTGAISLATGAVIADAVLQSGSYAGHDAAGYIIIVPLTGTFQSGEGLKVSGTSLATSTSVAQDRAAPDDDSDAVYLAAAVLRARNLIQPVPGSGPVRGAVWACGAVYAIKDNVGATAGAMWKATATGWQAVALGWSLKGTASGATAIAAGNVITGATSGATATVSRVIVDGEQTWAGGLAVRLILSAIAGAFVSGENIKVGGVALAASTAASSANTIPAGGRYQFIYWNFYGATFQKALYAANGVGPAFEFDGTVFSPIITNAPIETPHRVAQYNEHLLLGFPNGQLQVSQTGFPQGWNGTLGAVSYGLGDDITDIIPMLAGSVAICGVNLIKVLTGTSVADFKWSDFTDDVGAIPWTAQTMNGPVFMDKGGVRNLSATQAYGNFKVGTYTQLVQPILDQKDLAGITPIASLRCRAKSQYRLFFSDGTGLTIFLGAKNPSILPFDYGTRVPTCMWSGTDSNNSEVMLMGCADGYVYQIDKGNSFDGDEIDFFLRLAFNHCGSPNYNKVFKKLTLQVNTQPVSSTLYMTAAFSDGDPDQPTVGEQPFDDIFGGGAFWGEGNWNQFLWSSRTIGRADAHFEGIGTNFSPTIAGSDTVDNTHILSSYILTYSMRGPLR